MAPKLRSDDGDCVVIRPLAYVAENDIARYAALRRFPIIPCTLCGNQETSERREIKAMLAEWHEKYPRRIDTLFRSMKKVVPSHLLDVDAMDFDDL